MTDSVNLIDFPVTNRWSGEVQFTAKIAADRTAPFGVRLGLAVKWAFKEKANLRGADLYGANLGGSNLGGADLYGADLRGADLRGADLYGANLRGADLRGADLYGADLRGADLYGADLRGADLGGADLRGADLYGANLRGANLGGADLYGADLRGADLGEGEKIERLVARLDRSDGYQFIAFALEGGGVKIKAGCRWMTPADYREHVADEYPGTDKAAETLAIITFIETRIQQLGIDPPAAAALTEEAA